MRLAWTRCPYCGWSNVFLSRPKRFSERFFALIFLRLVRCHDCMRRFCCPIFLSAPIPRRSSPKGSSELFCNLQSPPHDNVQDLIGRRPSIHGVQFQSVDQEISDETIRSSSGAPVPQDDQPSIESSAMHKPYPGYLKGISLRLLRRERLF